MRRAAGSTKDYQYDDEFVNDVRRTFQACGIFLFQVSLRAKAAE